MISKKGFIEYGAIALILITTIGAFVVMKEAQHIYVGDSSTKLFYDYKVCPMQVNAITKENQMLLNTLKEANNQGYSKAEECRDE